MAAGETQRFTITARVASSFDGAVDNTATVGSDTPDPDPGNNEGRSHTPTRRAADLSIVKTPSTTASQAGGQVLYTLVIRNDGPSDATGVTVSDPGAPNLTLQEAIPSQGSCSIAGGAVTCQLGGLAAGGSAQVLVAAQVSPTATGEIVNSATVTGDQDDPRPGNNRDSGRVTSRQPPIVPPVIPPTTPPVTTRRRRSPTS